MANYLTNLSINVKMQRLKIPYHPFIIFNPIKKRKF